MSAVRSRSAGCVSRAYGSGRQRGSGPQQHLSDRRVAAADQLDGLARTRSSGSSCVISGSGSSSPAPKARTACAQAPAAPRRRCASSSCLTTGRVGSSPSAPGAGMPVSTSRPPRRSRAGGVARGASAAPGGLDDQVVAVRLRRSSVRRAEVASRRTAGPAPPGRARVPTTSSSAGEAAARNCTASMPERPGAHHRDPLAGPGARLERGGRDARRRAPAARPRVRSASSGQDVQQPGGQRERGRPSRRAG